MRSVWLCVATLGLTMTLASCERYGSSAPPPVHAHRTTATVSRQSQSGLIPANSALHDHIELSTKRVQAGGPLTATLVIVNGSSRAINLSSPCRPLMGAILTNKSMPPSAIGTPHPGDCLTTPLLVHPGTTHRYLGLVPTTYPDCTAQAGQQVMQCPPNGKIPPLPPGRYYAVLIGDGLALPPPTPAPVDVTAG